MSVLPVNEIFQTIQGEATHAGRPSIFIRLQGCGVGCPWCDTKHTWAHNPLQEIPIAAMIAKIASAPTWASMAVSDILDALGEFRAHHVVITGGEPCAHDLTLLTGALKTMGYSVQIETSGTQPVRVHDGAWVTVSPKLDMPGGYGVRRDALARADEIKMPVGKPADIDRLARLLALDHHRSDTAIYLQPLSGSPRATELCKDAAITNDWRISLQLHAYAGWR